MTVAEQVRALVAPLLADLGLEIYDLEHAGGVLRITIDRTGGVDLDAIALATRVVSRELDARRPDPRALHARGDEPRRSSARCGRRPTSSGPSATSVNLRTLPTAEGERRVRGRLVAADDRGISVASDDGTERRIPYEDIERARTVFEWGPASRPAKPRTQKKAQVASG